MLWITGAAQQFLPTSHNPEQRLKIDLMCRLILVSKKMEYFDRRSPSGAWTCAVERMKVPSVLRRR